MKDEISCLIIKRNQSVFEPEIRLYFIQLMFMYNLHYNVMMNLLSWEQWEVTVHNDEKYGMFGSFEPFVCWGN